MNNSTQVIRLLASGWVTKQIAEKYDVSQQHVIRLIKKKKTELGCKTLPELTAVMTRKNLL